jgi:hypothetical protein
VFGDELKRSDDDGRTWVPCATPRHGRITDFVMLETGQGLALTAERELLFTRDDGATFGVATPRPVHARGLLALGGELRIITARVTADGADYDYNHFDFARGAVLQGDLRSTARDGPLRASAWDADERRLIAEPTGAQWLAIRERDEPRHWQVSLVSFGEAPRYENLAALDDCTPLALGDDAVLAECSRRTPALHLLFTADGGKSFEDLALPGAGDAARPYSVERLSAGIFLLSRRCGSAPAALVADSQRARVEALDAAACEQYFGVVRDGPGRSLSLGRGPQGLGVFAWQASTPRLLGIVLADGEDVLDAELTRASSGAILVAARTKSRGFSLSRSFDEGRSFAPVTLPIAGAALALAGDRGLLLASAATPSEACAPARRCLQAFETNDAGSSWQRVPFPHAAGSNELACVSEGCLTGAGFRVGWELGAAGSTPGRR